MLREKPGLQSDVGQFIDLISRMSQKILIGFLKGMCQAGPDFPLRYRQGEEFRIKALRHEMLFAEPHAGCLLLSQMTSGRARIPRIGR